MMPASEAGKGVAAPKPEGLPLTECRKDETAEVVEREEGETAAAAADWVAKGGEGVAAVAVDCSSLARTGSSYPHQS